jgi:DNA (cytosine-5)-methyltransferase 1
MPPTHGPDSATGKPFITVEDAIIGDLPAATRRGQGPSLTEYLRPPGNWYQRWCRVGARQLYDHVWNDLGTDVLRRFALIRQDQSWTQVQKGGLATEDLKIRIDHRSVYRRLAPHQPSVTIVHFRKAMTIHPTEDRLITLREAARLQSFRDRFLFSRRNEPIRQMDQVQQQLANAVPPLLARAVARRLKARLDA